MKKVYIKPTTKVYAVKPATILNGSQLGSGYTSEQYAKSSNDDWGEE